MSLRHVFAGVALVFAVVACASTEQLPNDSVALDGIGGSTSGGATASGGDDGSGGASDTANSGGAVAASTSTGGTGESGNGGRSASPRDAGSGGARRGQSGGATAAGGARSSGGSADAGDAPDGSACPAGEKLCPGDSRCRLASPSIGCDPAGPCTACAAAPANGFSKCTNDACDFDCLSGFRRNVDGTGCISNNGAGGTGNGQGGSGGRTGRGGRSGSGGTTGTGGSTATCNPRNCPDCQSLLQAPCCHSDETCGCGLLGIGLLCGN